MYAIKSLKEHELQEEDLLRSNGSRDHMRWSVSPILQAGMGLTMSTSPPLGQLSGSVSQAAGQVPQPCGICTISKLCGGECCKTSQVLQDIHSNMCGVRLYTADTDTVSAGPTGTEHGSVIGAKDEGVALCIGQILGDGSALINIVAVVRDKLVLAPS